MRSINKIIYIIIGSFFFGALGVDRFMRGQVGLGILKLVTFGGFGVWALIDLIIGLTKLGVGYGDDFVFDSQGNWTK